MNKETFRSVLGTRFSTFLTFKRLGGADYRSQAKLLTYLDRFLFQERFKGRSLTREVIQRYLVTLKHLNPGTLAQTNRHLLFCEIHKSLPQSHFAAFP